MQWNGLVQQECWLAKSERGKEVKSGHGKPGTENSQGSGLTTSPWQNMKQKKDKALAGTVEWHGRSNGLEAHACKKGKYGLGRKMMNLAQGMPSLEKIWKAENMSLRAYMSFTLQELYTHQNVQQNQTRQQQRCEGQKRNGFRRKWSTHKGLKHHLLVSSKYIGGGPRVKDIRGCGLAVGRKRGFILGFPLKLF